MENQRTQRARIDHLLRVSDFNAKIALPMMIHIKLRLRHFQEARLALLYSLSTTALLKLNTVFQFEYRSAKNFPRSKRYVSLEQRTIG